MTIIKTHLKKIKLYFKIKYGNLQRLRLQVGERGGGSFFLFFKNYLFLLSFKVQEIKTFNLRVLISWGLGGAVSKVFNKLWKLNLKNQLLAFYF